MSIAGPRIDAPLTWFTSSYSNGAGGECVECALADGGALVRDSKAGGGPVIAVRGPSWETFVRVLRQGSREG